MKRPVVHFEIGCDNLDETSNFYEAVFGWSMEREGSSSRIEADSGIPGHITELGHDPRKYINIYIETDDIELDLNRVEANGGKRLIGPIDLPDGRTFAWFQDVAGNTLALITPGN